MKLKDRVAVVTGAGGGIGRAIALSLARRGCRLSLCDIRESELAQAARDAAALGVRCTQHCLDVADAVAVANLPREVLAAHGKVNLVVNNAGVALGGNFDQVSETEIRIRKAVVIPQDEIRFTEETPISLSDRDRDAFLNLLDNPPEPNPALRELLAGKAKKRG